MECFVEVFGNYYEILKYVFVFMKLVVENFIGEFVL